MPTPEPLLNVVEGEGGYDQDARVGGEGVTLQHFKSKRRNSGRVPVPVYV